MLAHRNIIVAGEDVGPKGGVYNVTAKLHERFGSVNRTDEQRHLRAFVAIADEGTITRRPTGCT